MGEAKLYFPPTSRISDSNFDAGNVAPPPVGLGLGLCLGLGHRKSIFTFLQLQELEHQALIYRYMVAGVPVPFHLVLPIWKSVVSASEGNYQYQPSFMNSSSMCFDYKNNMEPEPGRCRRTDGKKWRCSKDVVPDQKYCERHMHRGRQRSRKPVEGNTSGAFTTTSVSSTHLSISIPAMELENNTKKDETTTNNSLSNSIGLSPTSVFQSRPVKSESISGS